MCIEMCLGPDPPVHPWPCGERGGMGWAGRQLCWEIEFTTASSPSPLPFLPVTGTQCRGTGACQGCTPMPCRSEPTAAPTPGPSWAASSRSPNCCQVSALCFLLLSNPQLGWSKRLSLSISLIYLCLNMTWKDECGEWEGRTTRQALQFQIHLQKENIYMVLGRFLGAQQSLCCCSC